MLCVLQYNAEVHGGAGCNTLQCSTLWCADLDMSCGFPCPTVVLVIYGSAIHFLLLYRMVSYSKDVLSHSNITCGVQIWHGVTVQSLLL